MKPIQTISGNDGKPDHERVDMSTVPPSQWQRIIAETADTPDIQAEVIAQVKALTAR